MDLGSRTVWGLEQVYNGRCFGAEKEIPAKYHESIIEAGARFSSFWREAGPRSEQNPDMRLSRVAIVALLILAAGHAAYAAPATRIEIFTPYGPAGLSKVLSVSGIVGGKCFAESIADFSRPDAWRCMAGNVIHDPCFANPMGDGKTLACARTPWDNKVTVLNLLSPLPDSKRKEVPRRQAVPWALELANGDNCTLFTGATAPIAGMRINYGCPGGGVVVGDMDRTQAAWRVFYQKEGAVSLDQVDVVVAWY